nr:hypothetical protein [Rufibacter sediminis]
MPQLAERIHQNLTEVFPLFDDYQLEKVADTWTKDPHSSSDKEISLENGNVQQLGLKLRLSGFQRAGTQTFDLNKDLVCVLEYTSYAVGPDKNTPWLEKAYLAPWTNQELEQIAERWSEDLIEEITMKVQTLGK